jgi:hypothetical protein
MMCLERETAGQHDIETECLLYYDEVQRGVQARIRDSQWLLLPAGQDAQARLSLPETAPFAAAAAPAATNTPAASPGPPGSSRPRPYALRG